MAINGMNFSAKTVVLTIAGIAEAMNKTSLKTQQTQQTHTQTIKTT